MQKEENGIEKYADMLALAHPVSRTHPPMAAEDRAAQFSPFAALTGYEDEIKETARLTSQRVELDETERAWLDRQLQFLRQTKYAEAEVTYFQPDDKKEGGRYLQKQGRVRKIRDYEKQLVFDDGTQIALKEIISITIRGRKEAGKDEEITETEND